MKSKHTKIIFIYEISSEKNLKVKPLLTTTDNHLSTKALHSELLAELLGWFSSRNEYFQISEVRIVRHFFEVFGKFGISKFPKFPNIWKNQFPKFPNFFQNYRTFSKLFDRKTGFFCPKTSNFTSFFQNFRNFRIITELFTEL
jgi:hypothetical protein